MKSFRILSVVIALTGGAACSGATTTELSTEVESSSPSPSISETLPSVAPVPDLPELGNTPESNAFVHSCGDFSVTVIGAEAFIWEGIDGEWSVIERLRYPVNDQRGIPIAEGVDPLVGDFNGDGDPEILIDWYLGDSLPNVGSVFGARRGRCDWEKQTIIDFAGLQTLYDYLSFDVSEGLTGRGFAGSSPRESVRLVWVPEAFVWVGRSLPGVEICPTYYERFDLDGLGICTAGPGVVDVQQRLMAAGFDLNNDGYFGARTQLALIQYQAAQGLEVTGSIDFETWNRLFLAP